ncbi:MAG: hypothetical protein WCF19_00280 [Chlamydiales bacterium]
MRSLNPWSVFPPNLEAPVARSLSIQFILQALIDAFDLVQELKGSTPFQLIGMHLKKEIASISKELEKIYLFSLENPFAQRGSVLDKLCFYSEILLQASHVTDPEVTVVMEEMRKSILVMKSKIMVWKKVPNRYPLEEMLEQLMGLYSDLFDKLCRFFTALSPFLKEARSDENFLIYLIENKDHFNRHLGERKIEELLQSFFPAGHDQLRAAIHEGYTRRGFTTFLTSVEPLVDAIQWETPCRPEMRQ